MNNYTARKIADITTGKDTWKITRIGVFQDETQIGEYTRNYHTLFNTFFPFQLNGKDYALYSPFYTATRIMELPSCRDIGGEEESGYGFCPTDYYVPSYVDCVSEHNGEAIPYRIDKPRKPDELTKAVTPILFYPFGFVAGCIWGDDSSWKVQYLDLSQVDQGIIQREERFGYIELPDELSLYDAIEVDEGSQVRISIQKRFNLKTGTPCDE